MRLVDVIDVDDKGNPVKEYVFLFDRLWARCCITVSLGALPITLGLCIALAIHHTEWLCSAVFWGMGAVGAPWFVILYGAMYDATRMLWQE